MALTTEGASLTEAHRVAQVNLSGEALRDFVAIWRLLDPEALDSTFPGYARALQAVIDARREQSVRLSAAYLRAFRDVEASTTKPLTIERAGALAREQAMTSLLVTGPVTIKTARRKGATVAKAAETGFVSSAGAVKRLVLSGGRETLMETAAADPAAHGVARATDGDPCHFCAMLASRGAVFVSEASAAFKPHDACGCVPEIAYGGSSVYTPPGRGQEFADLWASSTKGLSGKAARNAFRRAYDASRV